MAYMTSRSSLLRGRGRGKWLMVVVVVEGALTLSLFINYLKMINSQLPVFRLSGDVLWVFIFWSGFSIPGHRIESERRNALFYLPSLRGVCPCFSGVFVAHLILRVHVSYVECSRNTSVVCSIRFGTDLRNWQTRVSCSLLQLRCFLSSHNISCHPAL